MDAHQETLRPHDRYEGRICAKKGEDVSIVKGRKRRGAQVHFRTIEERVYQVLEITSNGTSVFYRKEE